MLKTAVRDRDLGLQRRARSTQHVYTGGDHYVDCGLLRVPVMSVIAEDFGLLEDLQSDPPLFSDDIRSLAALVE